MPALRVVLIRHGETDWNLEKRFQGQWDVPMNAAGRAQAEVLALRLGDRPPPVAFLASDLRRARATAAPLAKRLGVEVRPEPTWRERNMGAFEGFTRHELGQLRPEALEAWKADRAGFTPPGGESFLDHRARIAAALEALRATYATYMDAEVWVVTHGGCVAAAVAIAQESHEAPARGFVVGNTSLSRFRLRDQGVELEVLGDVAHLPATP